MMDSVFQDLRYALRRLRNSRGFTAAATLTLAVGIGATTAMFSAVDAAILHPVPYPALDRVVFLLGTSERLASEMVSAPNFVDWQAQARSFDALGARGGRTISFDWMGPGAHHGQGR